MFSIEKNPLDLKQNASKVESSNVYNKKDHKCTNCHNYYRRCKCNRMMFNDCNRILKVIMVLIIFYMLCKLMCYSSTPESSNAFRLVKRY